MDLPPDVQHLVGEAAMVLSSGSPRRLGLAGRLLLAALREARRIPDPCAARWIELQRERIVHAARARSWLPAQREAVAATARRDLYRAAWGDL